MITPTTIVDTIKIYNFNTHGMELIIDIAPAIYFTVPEHFGDRGLCVGSRKTYNPDIYLDISKEIQRDLNVISERSSYSSKYGYYIYELGETIKDRLINVHNCRILRYAKCLF